MSWFLQQCKRAMLPKAKPKSAATRPMRIQPVSLGGRVLAPALAPAVLAEEGG